MPVGQIVVLKRGGAALVVVKIVSQGNNEHPEWGQFVMLKRDPSDPGGFFWEDEIEVCSERQA